VPPGAGVRAIPNRGPKRRPPPRRDRAARLASSGRDRQADDGRRPFGCGLAQFDVRADALRSTAPPLPCEPGRSLMVGLQRPSGWVARRRSRWRHDYRDRVAPVTARRIRAANAWRRRAIGDHCTGSSSLASPGCLGNSVFQSLAGGAAEFLSSQNSRLFLDFRGF
jgi:hypothetical protein